MFHFLNTRIPKELILIIIWDFVDPIPRYIVQQNKRRLNCQFKNPILFAVHEELLNVNLNKLAYRISG
jgi:hypothetical protein